MKNEAEWLELFDQQPFNDPHDGRFDQAWHWVQELEKGGRLTRTDVFALQCLIEVCCDPAEATPPAAQSAEGRVDQIARIIEPHAQWDDSPKHWDAATYRSQDSARDKARAILAALAQPTTGEAHLHLPRSLSAATIAELTKPRALTELEDDAYSPGGPMSGRKSHDRHRTRGAIRA